MQRPDTYIKPEYPYKGYPAHKDGAIALWEEATEAGADALQKTAKDDMENLLAFAHGNDQCDTADFKEMDKIAQRWNLSK